MATVTQQIPNYILGISDQPDELKLNGQVKDLQNAYPDITLGCTKRAGSRFIKKITGPSSTTITIDNVPYVVDANADGGNAFTGSDNGTVSFGTAGDITTTFGKFKVNFQEFFTVSTGGGWVGQQLGTKITIVSHTGTAHTNFNVGDNLYVYSASDTGILRAGHPDGIGVAQGSGSATSAGTASITLTFPSGTKLSWFNIYNDSENQYICNVDQTGQIKVFRAYDGEEIPVDYSGTTGTGQAVYLDNWSKPSDIQALTLNEQTFLCNRTKTTAMKSATADKSPALVNEAIIEIKTISYGKQYALNIYNPANPGNVLNENRATSIAARAGFTSPFTNNGKCKAMGREVINATATGKTNLRYEIDVRCTPVVDPDNEGTSEAGPQYDDSYQTYAKLQFGGEGWATGNTHTYTTEKGGTGTVEIKSHVKVKSYGNIARVRPAATSSSADEAVTSAGILGDIKTKLDAISNTNITATITGNCLHLKRDTPFAVETPENQLMNIITNETNNVGDLPTNCRHDYVVKIVNSGDEDDDFYLKFKVPNAGTGNQDYFGEGSWEECVAPSSEITIDKTTMPIKLVRELPGSVYPNGRFLAQEIDYNERNVGDNNTNPIPSFIDSNIEKMMFFRNRLVILSKANVILSKTNDFFNFFSTTAMNEVSTDPIDIQASSTFPTTLFDGIEVNTGLLLFSSNQQFMMTTDSDALTPTTAKINYLSSYNFNEETNPFSLGITSGFINSSGKNSRIFEMASIAREGEPQVLEQSKLISKRLPIDITEAAVSKENSLLMLAAVNGTEVWGFKFFSNGEKRIQSAWFRWSLMGEFVHHSMVDDVYYVVLKKNTNYYIEAIDLKTQGEIGYRVTNQIGTQNYNIHLDRQSKQYLASNLYNATTKKTVFTRPTGYEYDTAGQLVIYDSEQGDNVGQYALVNPVSGTNAQLEIEGNWTGKHHLILGYLYDYTIEIPTIFVTSSGVDGKTRSDTRSSLVVHRVHLNFGSVGNIDTTITRKGRVPYSKNFSAAETDKYKANELPIVDDYTQTIPLYERNTNLNIKIKSTHPAPATLHSMNWEGDYNSRYYRRV